MSSHNWPNSSPLPPPRQPDFRLQLNPSVDRPYNGHSVNFFNDQYSAYASAPMFNPYASTTPDPRVHPSQSSTNFGTMDSRALVAAALAPPLTPIEQASKIRKSSNRPSLSLQPITQPQPDNGASSSPLSEPPEIDIISESDKITHKTLPTKRNRQSRKRRHSDASDADNNYDDDASTKTQESPKKSRRTRSAMAKKSLRQQDSSDEEDIVLPTPPKKVVRKRNVTKRLIRKKPQGTKVPETLDDANEADRMMWFWKNSGKDWDEIRIEWARLTGVKPGKSSLSVRYIKLNENFARNGAAGHLELIKYRNEAMEELMAGLWDKVAEKMLAFNPLSEHNPKDLKRRYEHLERSGFDIAKVLAKEATREQEQEDVTLVDDNASEKDKFGLAQPSAQETSAAKIAPAAATPPDTASDTAALPDSNFATGSLSGTAFSLEHDLEMFDTGSLLNFDPHYNSASLKEHDPSTININHVVDFKKAATKSSINKGASATASAVSASTSKGNGLVTYDSGSD